MIREHRIVQDLIHKAQDELREKPNKQSSNISEVLLHHIELEEEFLYPAAKAAGELVKIKEKNNHKRIWKTLGPEYKKRSSMTRNLRGFLLKVGWYYVLFRPSEYFRKRLRMIH